MERKFCVAAIARNSILFPDKTALISPEAGHINYSRLDEILRDAEAFFAREGIRSGHRIAAVIPEGMGMAVAFLAVTASAVFIPLSPDYSIEQYRYFFKLLKIDGVILTAGAENPAAICAAEIGCPQFTLNYSDTSKSFSYLFSRKTSEPLPIRPEQTGNQDIAMICCTSGTTETPKSVMLSHENMSYSAIQRIKHFELDEYDRCLLVTPLHRSITLKAIQATLMAGGSVICWGKYSPSVFYYLLNTESPTWFFAGTAVLKSIIDHFESYGYDPQQGTIRFIRTGGAFAPEALVCQIEKMFEVPVVICYGLTETGIISSTFRTGKREKANSVGTIFGCEVIIRDDSGDALPLGRSGEITICGPGVMIGYENPLPDNETFVGGCFKTGDLGYLNASGELFLTGRLKEIINRGGEKISPFEVESAIRENPLVQDVAVLGIPGQDGVEEVGAALITKSGLPMDIKDLRFFLQKKISTFMMPTAICQVNEIPLNEAGKIDRNLLKMSFLGALAITSNLDPGCDEEQQKDLFERKLLLLWLKILKLNEIGLKDDFFVSGGDSLKAAELYSGIEADFGLRIPLSILFQKTTITDQAAYLRHLPDTSAYWPFLIPIRKGGELPPVFLVHAADGDVTTFHQLAEAVPEGYPLYGLRFSLEAVGWQHPIRLEDIARRYLQDVRSLQPRGPYRFAGACIGGVIAYEMARQLRADGAEAAFVGLFDGIITSRNTLKSQLNNNLQEAMELDWAQRRRWFAVKLSRRFIYYRSMAARIHYRLTNGGVMKHMPDRNLWEAVLRNAMHLYEPESYTGQIVFFSPEQASDSSKASLETWRRLAGKVTVVQVPGNHNTMYTGSNVHVLAEAFDRYLFHSDGAADRLSVMGAGHDLV